MIYFICYFSVFLGLIISLSKNYNIKSYFTFFVFSLFALIAGIKVGVGADYDGYKSYFNFDGFYKEGSELGYQTFISVSKFLVNDSFHSFLILQSIIYFILLYILFRFVCKEIHQNLVLPFFFIYSCQYYLGGIFGQSKQAIAILLITYSFFFLYKKRFFLTSIFFVLASSIHISVLVAFPAILFLSCPDKYRFRIAIPITIVFITLLFRTIRLDQIIQYSDSLTFLRQNIGENIYQYIEHYKYGAARVLNPINLLEQMIMLVISVYSIFKGNKFIRHWAFIYLFFILISFLFSDIAIFSQRFSRVFKFSEIFIIPIFFTNISNNKASKLIFVSLFTLLLFKPLIIIFSRPDTYLPYSSIFN